MTKKQFRCPECGQSTTPRRLFDALVRVQAQDLPACDRCGQETQLVVTFSFALGAGKRSCRVLAAFLPKELGRWPNQGDEVEFYPFLVVLQVDGGERQHVWLPYWHLTTSKEGKRTRKYGQWAPFIDKDEFESLLGQARSAGFLRVTDQDRALE